MGRSTGIHEKIGGNRNHRDNIRRQTKNRRGQGNVVAAIENLLQRTRTATPQKCLLKLHTRHDAKGIRNGREKQGKQQADDEDPEQKRMVQG